MPRKADPAQNHSRVSDHRFRTYSATSTQLETMLTTALHKNTITLQSGF